MRTLIYILFSGLMLTSIQSIAQDQPQKPRFGKGYYNIGDNQNKVAPRVTLTPDTLVANEVNKGYYAIKGHQDKLKQKSAWYWKKSTAPQFTKGYYTIGDNAKKLYQPL